MRLNKYIAQHTAFSRRAADDLISEKRVTINGRVAGQGETVNETDTVSVDGRPIGTAPVQTTTVMMNKPAGFVCSRAGQGSRTIYELLPVELRHLNSVGRLDKASSGLLLLSNDGELANRLTHPSFGKVKIYEVTLDKALTPLHQQMISDYGVGLADGPSKLQLEKLDNASKHFRVSMREGRNRQIRRTFDALGYTVKTLHRISFGDYNLGELQPGKYEIAG
jgi:23S rRNA pseudouridine2605 synthase